MHELFEIARHFAQRLRVTPLLLGWLAAGPLVALALEGWIGFAFGLINLVLVIGYALLIHRMTPDALTPLPIKRPRLELGAALALLAIFFVTQLLDFGVWTAQPWSDWVRGTFAGLFRATASTPGIPAWALTDVYLAFSSTIKKLIPTILAFVLLGYGRKGMGLRRPHWALSALLVGLTALFGLVTGVLLRAPLYQVLALYVVGIFVNALPEELFFRGLLLPRLEKAFANPLNALLISALCFNAMHIPIEIMNGADPLRATLEIFSIGYPSGLIWGYLYLRTRSIIPGTLWHAANGNLGFLMMSI